MSGGGKAEEVVFTPAAHRPNTATSSSESSDVSSRIAARGPTLENARRTPLGTSSDDIFG